MSLEEKADWIQTNVGDKKNHDRFGLYSQIGIQYGSPSTGQAGVSDNDALWTSQFAVPQVLRYAVQKTKNAENLNEIRDLCWRNVAGFELLNNVSGIAGLPARTVQEGEITGSDNWHVSETVPGFSWKGDTSADSLVGHHFYYAVAYKYLAENEEEKAKLSKYPLENLNYLVENDLKLIDVDGEPTKWGFFDPWKLNYGENPNERPLYSTSILSYLTAGIAYCQDAGSSTCEALFRDEFWYLYRVVLQKCYENGQL